MNFFQRIWQAVADWFVGIGEDFYDCFIAHNYWEMLLEGLGITLLLTLIGALLGIAIGLILALMNLSAERKGRKTIWSRIANVYIDIIRGTPSMLQLLIIYFIILAQSGLPKVVIAGIAFGINSSAYVAEIIRAGIMSIDKGQMEAGRSLGLNYTQTMSKIIIPQAVKNILPALGNEAIVLLKETAIAGYIALVDLTKAADFIVSRTYKSFMPLIGVAVIYFVVVKIMTIALNYLERRLRKSDSR